MKLSCRMYGAWRDETQVIAIVVESLIRLGYEARDIELECLICPGSRADVVLLTEDRAVVVECKRWKIVAADVPQAQRYLSAAHDRWPDRETTVWLVAPELAPHLPLAPGIQYATVSV